MRKTGFVFVILGGLLLIYIIIASFMGMEERGDNVPFIEGNFWAPILSTFFLGAGAALLVASRKKE